MHEEISEPYRLRALLPATLSREQLNELIVQLHNEATAHIPAEPSLRSTVLAPIPVDHGDTLRLHLECRGTSLEDLGQAIADSEVNPFGVHKAFGDALVRELSPYLSHTHWECLVLAIQAEVDFPLLNPFSPGY